MIFFPLQLNLAICLVALNINLINKADHPPLFLTSGLDEVRNKTAFQWGLPKTRWAIKKQSSPLCVVKEEKCSAKLVYQNSTIPVEDSSTTSPICLCSWQ